MLNVIVSLSLREHDINIRYTKLRIANNHAYHGIQGASMLIKKADRPKLLIFILKYRIIILLNEYLTILTVSFIERSYIYIVSNMDNIIIFKTIKGACY